MSNVVITRLIDSLWVCQCLPCSLGSGVASSERSLSSTQTDILVYRKLLHKAVRKSDRLHSQQITLLLLRKK
ncbi:MAG TPA: hypothetical protein V6C91_13895 [Coleofasciculaceae cyanobacterium]